MSALFKRACSTAPLNAPAQSDPLAHNVLFHRPPRPPPPSPSPPALSHSSNSRFALLAELDFVTAVTASCAILYSFEGIW